MDFLFKYTYAGQKYPFYEEDSTLGLKEVETINGNTEYKIHCVKYPDGYRVKGKHLALMSDTGKWTKKSNLFFDYEEKVYRREIGDMIEGKVMTDEGKIIDGFFTPNPYFNCKISMRGTHFKFVDYRLLEDTWFEDYAEGIYRQRSSYSKDGIEDRQSKDRLVPQVSGNTYSVSDDERNFQKVWDYWLNADIKIDNYAKSIGKTIPYTFGLELECISGNLPDHIKNKYGIIVCKDGSIRSGDIYPPEYVTVPYKGEKGIQSVIDITQEISKRSMYNEYCSLHIHFGGYKKSRLFMVALYELSRKIQDEIFWLVPYYKRDEIRYAGKQKNYAKQLPKIMMKFTKGNFDNYVDILYNQLYTFISGRTSDSEYNPSNRHNPFGSSKWNIPTRYYWINFVNMFFGAHDTVEFRLHNATLNSDKIIPWILLCSCIIKYAETHPDVCILKENITLEEVVSVINNGTVEKNLISYIEMRKKMFNEDYKNEDYMSLGDDDSLTFKLL